MKSPCVNGDIYADDTENEAYLFEAKNSFTIYGESNFEKCSISIRKLFDKKQKCKTNLNIDQADSCTFENHFIADVKPSRFLVILNYFLFQPKFNFFVKRHYQVFGIQLIT